MPGATEFIERLVKEALEQRGFVQRSPIRTGVWRRYLEKPGSDVRLLLIPLRDTSAGELCFTVNELLRDPNEIDWCAYNQSVVSGSFDFETLVTRILPLSRWWQRYIEHCIDQVIATAAKSRSDRTQQALLRDLEKPRATGRESGLPPELLWFVRMLGVVSRAQVKGAAKNRGPTPRQQLDYAVSLFTAARQVHTGKTEAKLFALSVDRDAIPCLTESVKTIKADASRETFNISCRRLTWAVIDSGIDRNHPSFTDWDGSTRVTQSLDFTRLGDMLRLASSPHEGDRRKLIENHGLSAAEAQKLGRGIRNGDDVDWDLVTRLVKVPPDDAAYFDGLDPHGTQVAGIIGAGESGVRHKPPGVCPDIRLLDLRVIASQTGDVNTEFHIISALQYIRHLNRNKDKPVVHGVNLSLSLPHSVEDYGCGQTPICEECDRLVTSGVVVVAAAGNYGFDKFDFGGPASTGGYRDLSITDPGNTDIVITVGSTHGVYPHRFGISYFSSRGPTGDGRPKPDLCAPGEAITCPSKAKSYEQCSGTSMAAPHVSGAAALLMARHRGLLGDPARVKSILCESATDLKRARDSQGYGLVDVMRAIQSI